MSSPTSVAMDETDQAVSLGNKNSNKMHEHPLQDVELKNQAAVEISRNNNQNHPKKKTWVQFDDDDNTNANNNVSIEAVVTTTNNVEQQKTSKKPEDFNGVDTSSDSSRSHQLPHDNQAQPSQASTTSDVTTPAVLATESVHINLKNSSATPQRSNLNSPATVLNTESANHRTSLSASSTRAPMRTIELSSGRIREGFANGDVIVTLLPTNTKWPWVTPAVFRPELVPEELMAQELTLTVEEYVTAMETLINDLSFTLYNICYKRVLVCWILFAFCVLLALLFSGLQGIALFSLGVGWLFLNAAAIFFCMWIKLRLSRGLEKCLARVNKQLLRHKILLVLDDRGRISCHKVNLCFIYFDPAQCVGYLKEFLERSDQSGTNITAGWESHLDVEVNDIVIQGSATSRRVSRKQAIALEVFLSYLQRWGKDFLRRRLDWTVDDASIRERTTRHLVSSMCPCQYEEEILTNKIKARSEKKCSGFCTLC